MTRNNSALNLLPKEKLVKTGEVDHADWNFRPVLGWIQQQRFKLIRSLLPENPVARLLEIGYGSGVFMPELVRHCGELYGIDVHIKTEEVAESLRNCGVDAKLFSSGAEKMPFENGFFDCAVAVSSLEFVGDIRAAAAEISRVLQPGGNLVIVTPGNSPLVDFGLKLLTGESAAKDYGERRQTLLPTLLEHFEIRRQVVFPRPANSFVRLYNAYQFISKK